MEALKLLGLCLIPLLLLIAGDITLSFLFRKITHRLTRFSLQAIFGILFAYGIFIVAQGILSELKVPRILWGGFFDIAVGLGIGVFISCGAGVGFGYKHGYPFYWGRFKEGFHFRILASIFPALSEEIVFRGVIVQTVSHLVGSVMGLTAGSIPFGILHLIGNFFGQSRRFSQILGISLAGFMLSLVYLNFGLLSAFLCHLVWNSTVDGWAKVFDTEAKSITESIEGSWITCGFLGLTSLVLILMLG